MEENNNAVKQEQEQEMTTGTHEVKHTVFGKVDQWIIDRRDKKAKKKAAKTPMSKGQKIAIAGGVSAAALGALGLGAKALVKAAAKYAEEDIPETVEVAEEDFGHPTEDEPAEETEET